MDPVAAPVAQEELPSGQTGEAAAAGTPGAPGAGEMEQEVAELEEATTAPTQPEPEVELVRVADRPLHLGATKEQWLFVDRPIDLDRLVFDHDMKHGQIRQLSEDLMKEKREQFRMEEPLGPVRALVVAQDLSGVWDIARVLV